MGELVVFGAMCGVALLMVALDRLDDWLDRRHP